MITYPSTGRRFRVLVGIAHGIAGVVLMMTFMRAATGFFDFASVCYVGSAVCGFIGGYIFAGLYGHNNDIADWLSCFVGAILASALGSLTGGLLLGLWMSHGMMAPTLPEAILISAFTAPALIMTHIPAEHPILMGVWYLLVIGIQVAATKLRLRGS